jgi:hypothetical protein
MGRFVRGSLVAVCFLFFPPSLPADGVHSFIERANSSSYSSINFTDADRTSVGRHFAFFESGTFGSNEDHLKWLDDSEDHHGNAWGWRKDHHHHHHDGDSGWSFGDQDNQDSQDTDGDSGNEGSTGSGDSSTSAVPEPSVLVLLSTALAAFLLKSLRRSTV